MSDAPSNGLTTLATVGASLGLVFAGVGVFQALVGVHMISSPWLVAFGLWAGALVLYGIGRRAGPSDRGGAA